MQDSKQSRKILVQHSGKWILNSGEYLIAQCGRQRTQTMGKVGVSHYSQTLGWEDPYSNSLPDL